MNRKIEEVEFTIFDLETTGLDPDLGDRVVEIAGIRFKADEKLATFQALVNPCRSISAAAFAVNRITAQMLEGAPRIEEVIPKFFDFIQGSFLCSYNAGFDLEFLNQELKLIGGKPLEHTVVVDVLKMARRLLPGLERYALWFVADKLGIIMQQEHRALSDVEMTWAVFKKLRKLLEEKGIRDLLNFSVLFGLDSGFLKDLHNQKVIKIQEAIDLGVRLKIKYIASSDASVSEREVIPKEIRQERNKTYLVGYCCLRNEERIFRIDGILSLDVL